MTFFRPKRGITLFTGSSAQVSMPAPAIMPVVSAS